MKNLFDSPRHLKPQNCFFFLHPFMPCPDSLVGLWLQESQDGQGHRGGLHEHCQGFGEIFSGMQGSQYFVTPLNTTFLGSFGFVGCGLNINGIKWCLGRFRFESDFSPTSTVRPTFDRGGVILVH